jgi:hypothetical protein
MAKPVGQYSRSNNYTPPVQQDASESTKTALYVMVALGSTVKVVTDLGLQTTMAVTVPIAAMSVVAYMVARRCLSLSLDGCH